jgi:hypothetical protein
MYLFQKMALAEQNLVGYTKTMPKRSEVNWSILKLDNIETKRTGSIVILYLKN